MSQLIFRNAIGEIYDDNIVISNHKFFIGSFESLRLLKYADKKINVISFLVAGLFLIITYVNVKVIFYFYLGIISSFIFILFGIFFKRKRYVLIVFRTNNLENETFLIKSRDKESVKEFLDTLKEFKIIKF
jgi:hypothetical protein